MLSHIIKTPGSNYIAVLTAARVVSNRVVGTSASVEGCGPCDHHHYDHNHDDDDDGHHHNLNEEV
jgi:hypothetical protein